MKSMLSARRFAFLTLFICLPFTAYAGPDSREAHEAYAREFAQQVVAILHDSKKSYSNNKDVLRRAFSDSVDLEWMARFVVARGWTNASPEQRERYTELYSHFLTETYIAGFAEDKEKRISDIRVISIDDKGEDFTVHTEMRLANFERLHVSYLVHDNDSAYRVRDIVIENVSLLATHRQEFAHLSANGGIEKVIAHLDAMKAQFASGKKSITLAMK